MLVARIYEVFPLLCSICRVGLRVSQGQNQLASSGCTVCSIVLAATIQTAEISGFWVPQIRAILGLTRLNFLSVIRMSRHIPLGYSPIGALFSSNRLGSNQKYIQLQSIHSSKMLGVGGQHHQAMLQGSGCDQGIAHAQTMTQGQLF